MSANANTINQTSYRRLLSKAMPMVIESEKENDRALAFVEKLMEKGEDISPEEEKLLSLLATLIQDFEEKFYKPNNVSPLEMLHHLMDARGVKQSDLWGLFGSKGIASEVLNGKRAISKSQAKALAQYFHVLVDAFI